MKNDSSQKNKKELQSEQTRQQIIEVATKLFARKGFYGTSIFDLTQAVGLTKGALYHHFEDKDALFLAVVESVQDTWGKAVANEVVSVKGSLEQIGILFEKHAELLSKNEFMCLVMSNLMSEMESVNPKYSSILEDVYEEFVLFVEQIVKAGQSSGEIRPDVDPRLLSLNIVGILKGIGCYPKLKRIPVDRIAMADSLKKVLLDGIKV
ncbi:MAG TPA: TetR/AcrR family transcriptional regulator [Clostridia bacterium]|nr:TetR/AcrR family transcriptional regulator [Clostridia bacterium]